MSANLVSGDESPKSTAKAKVRFCRNPLFVILAISCGESNPVGRKAWQVFVFVSFVSFCDHLPGCSVLLVAAENDLREPVDKLKSGSLTGAHEGNEGLSFGEEPVFWRLARIPASHRSGSSRRYRLDAVFYGPSARFALRAPGICGGARPGPTLVGLATAQAVTLRAFSPGNECVQ